MTMPMPIARLAKLVATAAVALLATAEMAAQQAYPTAWDPALLNRPDVRAALTHLEQGMPRQVEEWIHIAQMPGAPGEEQQRGAYVRAEMEKWLPAIRSAGVVPK